MYDIYCPYCGAGQEINHDDGYGYEEDELHRQDCSNCEKVFGYTTTISYDYEAEQIPCFNGVEHDLNCRAQEYKEFEQTRLTWSCRRCDHRKSEWVKHVAWIPQIA